VGRAGTPHIKAFEVGAQYRSSSPWGRNGAGVRSPGEPREGKRFHEAIEGTGRLVDESRARGGHARVDCSGGARQVVSEYGQRVVLARPLKELYGGEPAGGEAFAVTLHHLLPWR